MEKARSLPVIDLEKFGDSEESYKKLREACEEFGCFRMVNHGISPYLMAEMKEIGRSLFDRPIETKRRNVDGVISGTGYMAPTLDSPLYEALGFYDLASKEALRCFCDQLDVSSHQRIVIEKYVEAVHELYMDMGRKLAKSLGMKGDLFKGWTSQFRVIKYHFTPETLGRPATRTHTDSGFLTILQDDELIEGLEVMNKSTGEFEAVGPWPGTVVLILGDVAKVWSNGRFHNLTHKVQCKKASTRISIASFLLGPKEVEVEAPQELVDNEHPSLYAPFSYEEYRDLRLSKGMLAGEALELVMASSISSNLP